MGNWMFVCWEIWAASGGQSQLERFLSVLGLDQNINKPSPDLLDKCPETCRVPKDLTHEWTGRGNEEGEGQLTAAPPLAAWQFPAATSTGFHRWQWELMLSTHQRCRSLPSITRRRSAAVVILYCQSKCLTATKTTVYVDAPDSYELHHSCGWKYWLFCIFLL